MSHSTFDMLKPEIGKAIYDLKWSNFRDIQDQAIRAIVGTNNDVIISAPTASGKTEAAFIPSISESSPDINKALKILYISPLKALINDQFLRVEGLCKHLDCKVTKWHGDSSQTLKKKFLRSPSGIVLITPESLESFLINRSSVICELFKNIDYYVIDEVHSFVGDARGDQLRSVLNRIDSIIEHRPRRILLSATIGSLDNYKKWLNNDNPIFIEDKNDGKGIKGSIRHFESEDRKEGDINELKKIIAKGKKLIFGNSKGYLEETCSKLKSTLGHNSDKIDIHHGSLSKDQREFVENRLRKESRLSVFCTNTLELGIDIGNIDEVSLISPPWSVSSFVQKIGRSGRKENSQIEFSFILSSPPITSKSHICDGLRPSLVLSIALVELMLEGWCEPGRAQTNSYSTFVHQVMSYLAQKRSTTFDSIKSEIAQKSFSDVVSDDDFKSTILHLTNEDFISEDKVGNLTLGINGDRLTEKFDFYSVFFTPEEWAIHSETRPLGTIPLKNIFHEGDTLLFSGKRWKVRNIDFTDKVIQVMPATKGNPPKFMGLSGTVHKLIHEKMKSIYEEGLGYKYLAGSSLQHLVSAQQSYKLLSKAENFFPIFSGSGVGNLVTFVLRTLGHEFVDLDFALYLKNLSSKEVIKILKKYNSHSSIKTLISDVPVEELFFEKYDHLLPKDVLRKSFTNSVFNIEEYLKFIKSLT